MISLISADIWQSSFSITVIGNTTTCAQTKTHAWVDNDCDCDPESRLGPNVDLPLSLYAQPSSEAKRLPLPMILLRVSMVLWFVGS